jgi:hypothetical protein
MTIFHIKSKAGPDGKIHLGEMDVGVPNADVDVTVSFRTDQSALNDEELKRQWEEFVKRTAGSISDPAFKRGVQGEYPVREPLR